MSDDRNTTTTSSDPRPIPDPDYDKKLKVIVEVLRDVVSCSPQLLFDATRRLYMDMSMEVMAEQKLPVIAQNPTLIKRGPLRLALLLVIGKVLMSTKEIKLNERDTQAVAQIIRLFGMN